MFLNGKVGDKQFIDLTASYSYYNRKKNKLFKDLITLEEKLTSDPADQDTSVFTTFMTRGTYSHDDVTDWLKFQAGFDINLDYAASDKIAEDAESMQDFAFFTSLGLSVGDDFIFQPSLRFISNSQYEAPLIPSLNIKYNVNDYITMRASYARGFRAPSLKELYFLFVDVNHNIQGNNNLDAETSHSYNLTATVNLQNDDYVFRIEPKAFYNNITNLISLALVEDGLYSYVNIGDYKTMGVNLSLKYFRTNLSMTLGASYIGRRNKLNQDNEIDVPEFDYAPEMQFNCMYTFTKSKVRLSAFYKYTGEISAHYIGLDDDGNDRLNQYIKGDYHILDLSVSREFFDKLMDVSIGGKNLFDVKNIETIYGASGAPSETSGNRPVSFGRTAYVKIKFNF